MSNLHLKKAFQLVCPAVTGGGVLGTAFFQRFVKFFQQFTLVFRQFDRCFNGDMAVQVSRVAAAHTFDAFAAQAELLAGLRAVGNVNRRFAR